MQTCIHGRRARYWRNNFFANAGVFFNGLRFNPADADTRRRLEVALPVLLTIAREIADPFDSAVASQVLASVLMTAGAKVPESNKQEILQACDCASYIRAMQNQLEYREDPQDASEAELEHEKAEAQLAYAVVNRYYAEYPVMKNVKTLFAAYDINGGNAVSLVEQLAIPAPAV